MTAVLFTLTWNTSHSSDMTEALYYGKTHTFYGDKQAVYNLAFVLKAQKYKFITVRDALGRVVDTESALHDTADLNPTALLRKTK